MTNTDAKPATKSKTGAIAGKTLAATKAQSKPRAPRKPKVEGEVATVTSIAPAVPSGHDVIDGLPASTIVATVAPTIESLAPSIRAAAAKDESQALKIWKEAGSIAANRPPTPVIDWMTNGADAPKAPRGKKATGERKARTSTKTFKSADHPDGHTCDTCSTVKPVTAFPTVDGPAVRATRCRACRDAAKVTG